MRFYRQIRNKLVFAFSLVTLIPALVVWVYSMQVSSKSLLDNELSDQAEKIQGIKQWGGKRDLDTGENFNKGAPTAAGQILTEQSGTAQGMSTNRYKGHRI